MIDLKTSSSSENKMINITSATNITLDQALQALEFNDESDYSDIPD